MTTNAPDHPPRLSRREVIKWIAATTAAMNLPDFAATAQTAVAPTAKGYGTDPDLSKFYGPGDFWPLTFTPAQRQTATALADLILPADHLGPAASEVRVPDYLDEWLSAPYPPQQKDREALLPGLQWLEDESRKRFAKDFAALSDEQKRAIADDICWPADAKGRLDERGAVIRQLHVERAATVGEGNFHRAPICALSAGNVIFVLQAEAHSAAT